MHQRQQMHLRCFARANLIKTWLPTRQRLLSRCASTTPFFKSLSSCVAFWLSIASPSLFRQACFATVLRQPKGYRRSHESMDVGRFPAGSIGADRSSRNARQENTNSDQREQPTGVGCADIARICLYAQKERGSAIAKTPCGAVDLRSGRYGDRTCDNLLVREVLYR